MKEVLETGEYISSARNAIMQHVSRNCAAHNFTLITRNQRGRVQAFMLNADYIFLFSFLLRQTQPAPLPHVDLWESN